MNLVLTPYITLALSRYPPELKGKFEWIFFLKKEFRTPCGLGSSTYSDYFINFNTLLDLPIIVFYYDLHRLAKTRWLVSCVSRF